MPTLQKAGIIVAMLGGGATFIVNGARILGWVGSYLEAIPVLACIVIGLIFCLLSTRLKLNTVRYEYSALVVNLTLGLLIISAHAGEKTGFDKTMVLLGIAQTVTWMIFATIRVYWRNRCREEMIDRIISVIELFSKLTEKTYIWQGKVVEDLGHLREHTVISREVERVLAEKLGEPVLAEKLARLSAKLVSPEFAEALLRERKELGLPSAPTETPGQPVQNSGEPLAVGNSAPPCP
jgi:hypothetical protein